MKLIGQNRSWLSCPIAAKSLLLQISEKGSEKYSEIISQLKNIQDFKFENKIFTLSNSKSTSLQNKVQDDFSQLHGYAAISEWVNKNDYKNFDLCKYLSGCTEYPLVNLTEFKMNWLKLTNSKICMTIYNTFTYTEDIKYEARILEIPLENKYFKLVILVPNEIDMTCSLFKKLVESGMKTAVQSIQPLFKVASDLISLNIEFEEENEFTVEKNNCNICQGLSIGKAKINQQGVMLKCLTCIHSENNLQHKIELRNLDFVRKPFLFAIMFHDTAIFTGQYISDGFGMCINYK